MGKEERGRIGRGNEWKGGKKGEENWITSMGRSGYTGG